MNREDVEAMRRTWEGRRVRLLAIRDGGSSLRPGAMGTVSLVDSAGTVHVRFDNGINLGLLPGVDEWMLVR